MQESTNPLFPIHVRFVVVLVRADAVLALYPALQQPVCVAELVKVHQRASPCQSLLRDVVALLEVAPHVGGLPKHELHRLLQAVAPTRDGLMRRAGVQWAGVQSKEPQRRRRASGFTSGPSCGFVSSSSSSSSWSSECLSQW